MTANGKTKKPTVEELLIHARNLIEASHEHLAEFRRQKISFNNSHAKKDAEGMFPHKDGIPQRIADGRPDAK